MGQSYVVVNLDKRQVLNPHKLGDGYKLMELNRTLQAMAILCSQGNGSGGGDCRSENPIIGSWAGDRVVVAGDYADKNQFAEDGGDVLYDTARDEFAGVEEQCLMALLDDGDQELWGELSTPDSDWQLIKAAWSHDAQDKAALSRLLAYGRSIFMAHQPA